MNSIYECIVKNKNNEDVSLSSYKGKVLLIVNTATGCGFTPQYKELEQIYKNNQMKGLEILDFPCNQFANQAPGNDEEIGTFCTGRFGITFKQFKKIDVNGKNESPLYTYIKNQKHGICGTKKIKWNFTKFLVNKEGKVVKRYSPTTNPIKIEKDILKLLAQ